MERKKGFANRSPITYNKGRKKTLITIKNAIWYTATRIMLCCLVAIVCGKFYAWLIVWYSPTICETHPCQIQAYVLIKGCI